MSTIKDVARLAGVSVATVSRVLNGEKIVTSQTAERVQQAIQKLDYNPNMLGRNLRKAQTRKILVLIPTMSNQFYSKVIRGIESEAQQSEYYPMVCATHGNPLAEEKYLTLLRTKLVDGVIFLNSTLPADEITALGERYPIVQCCEYLDGSDTSSVMVDNEQAGYEAVTSLIKAGHRRIMFLGSSDRCFSSEKRLMGYRRALQTHSIPIQDDYILLDTFSYKSGIRSADRMLSLPERPTAIFAVADSIAIGVIKRLLEKGYKVPRDCSIIGFDNVSIAEMYTPSLSTVAQPQFALGSNAFSLLLEKMHDLSSPNKQISLACTLICRETTENKGE